MSTQRSRSMLALAAALLAGCAPGEPPMRVFVDGTPPASAPAYLSSPDLAARSRAAAAGAAEAWGAPRDATDGWVLVWALAPFECAGGDADRAVGCTRPRDREIELLAWGAACPEATALAHEVGHVAIGDPRHEDARWCDRAFWGRVRAALEHTAPASCPLDRLVDEALDRCAAGEREDDD